MDPLFSTLYQIYQIALEFLLLIPGSSLVINYMRSAYKNDPFRIFLEGLLVIFTIKYLTSKRYRLDATTLELTKKEENELIEDWQPQPLVPETSDDNTVPEISGPAGLVVTLSDGKRVINVTSFNFLSLLNNESIKTAAIGALRKYGVGSCGPPGFYGTLDVHLDLEAKIAKFLKTEAAILYSQAFSAVASVIPAFSKRDDIIVCDSAVHFPIQKGIQISRSFVYHFKHNDMDDLERVLNHVQQLYLKKPLQRRFIVVEGLYVNSGNICPLPRIVELKEQFKYRLIVDETFSVGSIGHRGAGVCDFFNIPTEKVEIIVGSIGHAFASAGGYCAGSIPVVDHQRLSSQAYCFSASLPATLAVSAFEGIVELERHPEWIRQLKRNVTDLKPYLRAIRQLTACGDPCSPIIHLYLAEPLSSWPEESETLQHIVDESLLQGLWLTRARYVEKQERVPIRPSIRLGISAGFDCVDIESIGTKLQQAVHAVFSRER